MLILDAYNVLHVPMPPALAGLDEAGLCVAISRSVFRHEPATVVCDGRPKPLGVDRSPVDSVELIYSGVSRQADDVIVDLVARATAPKRITVVTNDRAIRTAVRRRRAKLLHSEDFIIQLAGTLGQAGPRRPLKPGPDDLDDDEVRQWLSEFGFEE